MAHVQSVKTSIEFYARLGFQCDNTFEDEHSSELRWAWLSSHKGGDLMLARASGPIDAEQQAVLFYIYVDDMEQTRDALVQAGVQCGDIKREFYAPRGEFRVHDPDGYVLMIMQTGS
jgi:hypothetical protein